MAKPMRHFYPDGQVERAPARNGWIGYHWVPAYAEALPGRSKGMPLPRRDIYAMARRDGWRAVFHDDEGAARAAVRVVQGRGHRCRCLHRCD